MVVRSVMDIEIGITTLAFIGIVIFGFHQPKSHVSSRKVFMYAKSARWIFILDTDFSFITVFVQKSQPALCDINE